jgi:hypothetical protein
MINDNFDFKNLLREGIDAREDLKTEIFGFGKGGKEKAPAEKPPPGGGESAERLVSNRPIDNINQWKADLDKAAKEGSRSAADLRRKIEDYLEKALETDIKTGGKSDGTDGHSMEAIQNLLGAKDKWEKATAAAKEKKAKKDKKKEKKKKEKKKKGGVEDGVAKAPDGSAVDIADELTAKYMKDTSVGGVRISPIKVMGPDGMAMMQQDIQDMLNYDPNTVGKRSGRLYQAQDGNWYVITGLGSKGLMGYQYEKNKGAHEKMHSLINKVVGDLKAGGLKESTGEELELRVDEFMQKVINKINENNKQLKH